jgi:hypothetical protein
MERRDSSGIGAKPVTWGGLEEILREVGRNREKSSSCRDQSYGGGNQGKRQQSEVVISQT